MVNAMVRQRARESLSPRGCRSCWTGGRSRIGSPTNCRRLRSGHRRHPRDRASQPASAYTACPVSSYQLTFRHQQRFSIVSNQPGREVLLAEGKYRREGVYCNGAGWWSQTGSRSCFGDEDLATAIGLAPGIHASHLEWVLFGVEPLPIVPHLVRPGDRRNLVDCPEPLW